MIGKGPKRILISKILGQETFKWYFKKKNVPIQVTAYPYFNELIRGFTINSITLSVIRILEPSFAVKESFAYRYHERFLFEITFKSLLIQNFRY